MPSGYVDRSETDLVELRDKAAFSRWRIVLAFILTPLLVALLVAAIMPLYAGLPNHTDRFLRSWLAYAVFGAFPATIVFGIPGFVFLRKLTRPTLLNCGVAGGMVAALPWLFLGLLSVPDQASTDGRATVIDGSYTAYGWLEFGEFLLLVAAAGVVGGLIFWTIAAAKMPNQSS